MGATHLFEQHHVDGAATGGVRRLGLIWPHDQTGSIAHLHSRIVDLEHVEVGFGKRDRDHVTNLDVRVVGQICFLIDLDDRCHEVQSLVVVPLGHGIQG